GLAVGKSPDQRLPSRHAQESADLVGQRLVCRAAENLELVVHTHAMRLALVFLVSAHADCFLFRCCCKSSHCSCRSSVVIRSAKLFTSASRVGERPIANDNDCFSGWAARIRT